jgi:PAS domain-containing protein
VLARFVMDTDILSGAPGDLVMLAEWWMHTSPHPTVYVLDDARHLLGWVHLNDVVFQQPTSTLGAVMESAARIPTIRPDESIDKLTSVFAQHKDWGSVPVVDEGNLLLGVVSRNVPRASRKKAPVFDKAMNSGLLAAQLFASLNSGFMLIDGEGLIRQLNAFGGRLLGVTPDQFVGRPYEELAPYIFPHMRDYLRLSGVPEILSSHRARADREFVIHNGRHIQFSYGAVRDGQMLAAIAVTFVDVTPLRRAQAEANALRDEAQRAFGLALPNTKVEVKLKASPEYQDVYDPETGRATVTDVIHEGTYWHVINGLRMMAELKDIGLFQLVGLDKDTMVQAFIFHDIGKDQPSLVVGQEFVPTETFEPGALHAARSADWAVKEYGVSSDVAWLIRYHHTAEPDLPEEFPAALKPMWRIFMLVDGLSAGITRRQATVAPITLDGTTLTIRETNRDKRYHRAFTLSVYSGASRELPDAGGR